MGKKEGWWEAGGWWIRWRGRRNWKETERRKMRAKDLFEAHFPQSDLEFLFSKWNDVQQTFCFNSNVSSNPLVGNTSCCCMLSSVESPRHDFQRRLHSFPRAFVTYHNLSFNMSVIIQHHDTFNILRQTDIHCSGNLCDFIKVNNSYVVSIQKKLHQRLRFPWKGRRVRMSS